MIPHDEWAWHGIAGHLIVGSQCRFHLCTVVGPYIVSTVGEYLPDESVREVEAKARGIRLHGRGDDRRADFLQKYGFIEIGLNRLYETMVFRHAGRPCTAPDCDCGLPEVEDWGHLDFTGYNQRGAATRGHIAMCETWAAKDWLEAMAR